MASCDDFKELTDYYSNYFIPAYADLVSLTADKPAQVLVEIENFNSHIMAAFRHGSDSSDGKSNISKAKTHLQRATLDCYKLLFVEINNRIREFVTGLSTEDVAFTLGDSYHNDLKAWHVFSQEIRKARKNELSNTGTQKIEDTIEQYNKAVNNGFELYEKIVNSLPKIAHVRKHLFWHSVKAHWPFHAMEILFAGSLAYLVHHFATTF